MEWARIIKTIKKKNDILKEWNVRHTFLNNQKNGQILCCMYILIRAALRLADRKKNACKKHNNKILQTLMRYKMINQMKRFADHLIICP